MLELHYPADEEWEAYAKKESHELPRFSLTEARERKCAWIAESDVFAAEPVRSHFNLLDPVEEQHLRSDRTRDSTSSPHQRC